MNINEISKYSMIASFKTAADGCKEATNDDYFMSMAFLVSSRASSNSRTGAIIVKNNMIISVGHADFQAGDAVGLHSEQIAICAAARHGVSIEGATLYSTHAPCVNCTKLIIESGLTEFKYSIHVDLGSEFVNSMVAASGVKKTNMSINRGGKREDPCADCDHAKRCASHACPTHK